MQGLKIYICIEDPITKQDVNIKGNFEILRAFLSSVRNLEIQAASNPFVTSQIDDPKKEGSHATD